MALSEAFSPGLPLLRTDTLKSGRGLPANAAILQSLVFFCDGD